MKGALSLKMLGVLALVLLVCRLNDGRIVSKCELKALLDGAQFQVGPDNGTIEDLITRIVCRANRSGFNTHVVKFITKNHEDHAGDQNSSNAHFQVPPQAKPQRLTNGSSQAPTQFRPRPPFVGQKQDPSQEQRPTDNQGQPRPPAMGQGKVPSMGQGKVPSMGQGQAPRMGQGKLSSIVQGEAPLMGQGKFPSMGQGQAPPMGQGQAPPMGQGQAPPMGQGQAPPMGQGQAPSMGQGQAPPMGQGQAPPMGQGQAPPTPSQASSRLLIPNNMGSASQEKDSRRPAVWHRYGLFQLNDRLACDSGVVPTLNVCQMNCSALINDDISDDIICLKTVIETLKGGSRMQMFDGASGPQKVDNLWVKECQNVVPSQYFAECQ